MLALGFLLMIGTALIAEGFGVEVPKSYVYAAMAFSALVEGLNMIERRLKKEPSGLMPQDRLDLRCPGTLDFGAG